MVLVTMGDGTKSLFAGALDVLPRVKGEVNGNTVVLTSSFIDACKEVLPVVDVFGSAMAIVKSDIGGNIERLTGALKKEPEKYKDLYAMVRDEKEAGTATGKYSNTNAILWLTRAMDFLLGLLRRLEENKSSSVKEAADASYLVTLKPYHGWLAQSAFSLAMQFCPTRDQFFAKLGAGYKADDLLLVLEKFEPLLKENHEYLDSMGYDKLSAI